MKIHAILRVMLLAFILLQASCEPAPTPTAQPGKASASISKRKTNVQAGPESSLHYVEGTEELPNNASVKVTKGGIADLDFPGQISLRLFNDTSVGGVSAEVAAGTPGRIHMRLERGGLCGQVVKTGHQATFEIANGTTISILGTQFFIIYDPGSGVASAGNFDGSVYYTIPGRDPAPLPAGQLMDIMPDRSVDFYDLPFNRADFLARAEADSSPIRGLEDLRLKNGIPLPGEGKTQPSSGTRTPTATPRPTKTPTPTPTRVVTEIDKKYNQLAAAGVYLGDPLGPEMALSVEQGRYRDYQVGSIYWSPATGAFEVHGGIRDRWLELKGAYGVLGLPLTDETGTGDGAGRYNHFQYGSIYWSPSTGGFEVYGSIRDKWFGLGAEQSMLGYPTSGELGTPDGKGRYNRFQHGSIYAGPSGTFEIDGAIDDKWASLGREQSMLGYPAMDVGTTPDGKGHYTHFQYGSIYWSPSTGAFEVHGSIRQKWSDLGWEKSVLGYPTSDEQVTPDGKAFYSRFQYGSIYAAPPGTFEIHGPIDDKWASMGREQSVLGYPLMDVGQAAQKGSLYTRFEHGNIYWSLSSGAHEVHGVILDEYANWKWEQGCLGFPISDVEVNPTSLVAQQSRFQNGDIILPTVGSLYTLCPRPIVQ